MDSIARVLVVDSMRFVGPESSRNQTSGLARAQSRQIAALWCAEAAAEGPGQPSPGRSAAHGMGGPSCGH